MSSTFIFYLDSISESKWEFLQPIRSLVELNAQNCSSKIVFLLDDGFSLENTLNQLIKSVKIRQIYRVTRYKCEFLWTVEWIIRKIVGKSNAEMNDKFFQKKISCIKQKCIWSDAKSKRRFHSFSLRLWIITRSQSMKNIRLWRSAFFCNVSRKSLLAKKIFASEEIFAWKKSWIRQWKEFSHVFHLLKLISAFRSVFVLLQWIIYKS